MDILDPLEVSEDIGDDKIIINDTENIHPKLQIDSDEEQTVLGSNHLSSPGELLEASEEYSLRSPEGMVTYRVLQVSDDHVDVPHLVGTSYTLPGNQQVLTSNINGQLYVINSNEIISQPTTTRTIAPRLDGTTTVVNNIKKRDDRRRATHNEVERRRRDKINNWITKLSKIIPDTAGADAKGNGQYDGQSKGGILQKACDYIMELKDLEKKHENSVNTVTVYLQTIELLKNKNSALERENRTLREFMSKHGLEMTDSLS